MVGTFHDVEHGYNTLRVFNVDRPDGTPLAWAKTSWLLLDLASGRPVRPKAHLPRIDERYTGPIDPDFPDVPTPEPDAPCTEVPWPIRFHDLDVNAHVNNAAYFEWIFEATPIDPMEFEPRGISASFRSGIRWGGRPRIHIASLPERGRARSFAYRITDDGRPGEKPMTLFSCSWEPCRS